MTKNFDLEDNVRSLLFVFVAISLGVLSTWLFMISMNWIFHTEIFTFWRTALLLFWIGVMKY